jgi:hypothetical protein
MELKSTASQSEWETQLKTGGFRFSKVPLLDFKGESGSLVALQDVISDEVAEV